MNDFSKAFSVLQFFALDRQMAAFTKSNTITSVKPKFWVACPRVNVVGLNVAIAGLAAHLTSVIISFVNSLPPCFVLKARMPLLSFVSVAALPLWIFFATKTTFQTIGDLVAGFIVELYAKTWTFFAYSLLGNFAKTLALMFRQWLTLVPPAASFGFGSFRDAVSVKQFGYARLRRFESFRNTINTHSLNGIKFMQLFFAWSDCSLRLFNVAALDFALPEPIVNRLSGIYASQGGNLFARLLFSNIQPVQGISI